MSVDTSTIARAGMGANIAGVGLSAMGAMNASRATRDAANYNATVAENNAQLIEWRRQSVIERGQKAVAAQGLRTRRLAGRQRASFAQRGIDMTEGAALEILTDTAYMGEIDANQIKDNAAMEAWALRQEVRNTLEQARMLRARAAAESPATAGLTTLLTGAGKVADKWLTLNEKGAFNRRPAPRGTFAGDFEADPYGTIPISEFQN